MSHVILFHEQTCVVVHKAPSQPRHQRIHGSTSSYVVLIQPPLWLSEHSLCTFLSKISLSLHRYRHEVYLTYVTDSNLSTFLIISFTLTSSENMAHGRTLQFHNFSWKGDPRWAGASRYTLYGPAVVAVILVLSIIQIALGATWQVIFSECVFP